MHARILLAVSAVVFFSICTQAQSTQFLVPQNDGWRLHLGDDPAWADPAFDDSTWTPVSLNLAADRDDLIAGRSRWFRKRIHLPADPEAINLIVTNYDGSYEVYADGSRIGPPIQSSLRWINGVTRIFPLRASGDPAGHDVEIAIRSHLYDQVYFFPYPPAIVIGNPAGATLFKAAADGQRFGAHIASLTVNLIMVLAGLILLSLYFQQRGRREYLWLGLCVLFNGLSTAILFAQYFIPVSWNGFLGDPCEYWFFAAFIQFIYVFAGHKPHRAARAYQWFLVAVPFVFSPLGWTGALNVTVYGWLESIVVLPGILVPILLLITWARRGNREATVLILPMILANSGYIIGDAETTLRYLHPSYQGIPRIHFDLLTIRDVDVTQTLFLLAIGLVIFLRFVRVSQEQVRTQAELESARAIQQVLIPAELPAVRGFRIESVYHPAQQVGGDFFQILPLGEGGVLAVVGDVAGKGMPAALTVALIVGTFRTLAEITTRPAEILAGLNRRLVGRSAGFTTCLAVRVLASGESTLASAGHLNPYLSSARNHPMEITPTAGLPLGLSDDTEYEEVPFSLAAGETLTFLSDGVVEARNAQGELFGFERARAVSSQPADEIARTAESFGQEDDITVVTLTVLEALPA
jgi:phosphoserine phosphatase RsbU/P